MSALKRVIVLSILLIGIIAATPASADHCRQGVLTVGYSATSGLGTGEGVPELGASYEMCLTSHFELRVGVGAALSRKDIQVDGVWENSGWSYNGGAIGYFWFSPDHRFALTAGVRYTNQITARWTKDSFRYLVGAAVKPMDKLEFAFSFSPDDNTENESATYGLNLRSDFHEKFFFVVSGNVVEFIDGFGNRRTGRSVGLHIGFEL